MKHYKQWISMVLIMTMLIMSVPASVFAAIAEGSSEELQVQETGAVTRGEWFHELVSLNQYTVDPLDLPDVYFPDIEDSEYFEDIMVATYYGLVDVDAGDLFEPNAPVTREIAAHTLNYTLGIVNQNPVMSFSDTDQVSYNDDVQVALDLGWFELQNGAFVPNMAVTAAELQNMKSSATQFLEDRSVGEAAGEFQFADYVKVFSEDVDVQSTYDFDTNEKILTVSGYNGALMPGDVFVYYYQEIPFIYAVKSISSTDGVYTIHTEQAPEDAVLKYDFEGSIEPDLNFYVPDNSELTLMAEDGTLVTFGDPTITYDRKTNTVKIDRDTFKADGIKAHINATIKLDQIELKAHGFKDVTAIVSGNADVVSSLEVDPAHYFKNSRLPLGFVELGPFGCIELDLDIRMDGKCVLSSSVGFEIGFTYSQGDFRIIHHINSNPHLLDVEINIQAMLGLRLFVEAPTVGNAVFYLAAGPCVKYSMKKYYQGLPMTCKTTQAYFGAKLSVNCQFWGYTDGFSRDIYNESNSPIRFYEHLEDGCPVSACTRNASDAGTATEGYHAPKYTTPSDSRQWSGLNGSTTGYGGSGSRIPAPVWEVKVNEDETLTITKYLGYASYLTIPRTIDGQIVKSIGKGAFSKNTTLKTVIIPGEISLEDNCFSGNTSLQKVILQEGITHLGTNTFSNCTSLSYVEIPSTVESCYYPFVGCTSLSDVTIGEGMMIIPSTLFGSSGLTDIMIPDTVVEIKSNAFSKTNLKHLEIPDSVTEIGNTAFTGCSMLESVQLSANLIRLGTAFNGCSSLKEIEFPEGLTEIVGNAFVDCTSLKKVYFPSTLKTCGNAFLRCNNLDTIIFGEGISAIPANLFNGCVGLKELIIPDTVKKIGDYAFKDCTSLKKIVLPEGLTELGKHVCVGCTSLTDINLPSLINSVPENAFIDCTSLDPMTVLRSGITNIEYGAFQNSNAVNVDLPDSITNIGNLAFANCKKMVSFKASNDLVSIGAYAFQNDALLASVELNDGLSSIGNYAFDNCSALTEIVIPDSVSSIGTYCFQKNTKLASVKLPKGLIKIPSYAFATCPNLTEMVIPNGVISIGNNAFYQCTKLKTFTIPPTVTSIGSNAFSYASTTTVYGYDGSYVQTYAGWKEFIDISNAAQSVRLANGTDTYYVFYNFPNQKPEFVFDPEDAEDAVVSLKSSSGSIVSVADILFLKRSGNGKATITATTASGLTYQFTAVTKSANRLEIAQLPEKTTYQLHEKMDLTGLRVRAVSSDNCSEEIKGYTITGFDTESVGIKTVTVSCGSVSTTFEINVERSYEGLIGIEMASLPAKQTYLEEKDPLDLSGAVVRLLFKNRAPEEIPLTMDMVSGFDNTIIGTQSITVTCGLQKTTFDVEILEKQLKSIAIAAVPSKIRYELEKEMLDVSGGQLSLLYDNDTTGTVAITEDMVSGFDNSRLGEQILTVTYENLTTTYAVTVSTRQLTGITVLTSPIKTKYICGMEVLSTEGGQLTLKYDDGSSEIISMTEEMVSGFDNTLLGTQNLTVSFGGKTAQFTIRIVRDSSISDAEDEVLPGDDDLKESLIGEIWCTGFNDVVYNGAAAVPDVRIYNDRIRLDDTVDYTVKYSNNKKVGLATAVITFKGIYKSIPKVTRTFHVLPADINDTLVNDLYLAYNNGRGVKVSVTPLMGKLKLKLNKDFILTDENGISVTALSEVGEYDLTLTGKGNFTGERSILAVVTGEILMSKAKMSFVNSASKKSPYTGAPICPKVIVKNGKIELQEGVDYSLEYENNLNEGTAYVVAVGMGTYEGELRLPFTIVASQVKKAVVLIDGVTKAPSYEYTGNRIYPDLELKLNGCSLVEDDDYTVRFLGNRNVGSATILITGINGFSGTVKKTFKITPVIVQADALEIGEIPAEKYLGVPVTPPLELYYDGRMLVENRDYTVKYSNNKAPADEYAVKKPTAAITFKGNYKGKASAFFVIK